MNIHLHIERLVLDGLPVGHGQSALIKAAVEAELKRLLAEHGLNPDFRSGVVMPSVHKTPGIHMTDNSSPTELGRRIAKAVYGGIGK